MALLHGGSPIHPDGISYHTSLRNISNFRGGAHQLMTGKLDNAAVQRNGAWKKMGLKIDESLRLLSVGGTWDAKENLRTTNKSNSTICSALQRSATGSMSPTFKGTKVCYPAKYAARQSTSSAARSFMSSGGAPETQLVDIRVDLERELAHEAAEEDEEDECIFQVGSSTSYTQSVTSSKASRIGSTRCCPSEPLPISASNSFLEAEQPSSEPIGVQGVDGGLIGTGVTPSRKGSNLPKVPQSSTSSTAASDMSLTTISADNGCKNGTSMPHPPLYFTHSYSFEKSALPSSMSSSVTTDSAASCTGANNTMVTANPVNANQSHVIVRLQNGQMLLCQTLPSNCGNQPPQLLPAAGFWLTANGGALALNCSTSVQAEGSMKDCGSSVVEQEEKVSKQSPPGKTADILRDFDGNIFTPSGSPSGQHSALNSASVAAAKSTSTACELAQKASSTPEPSHDTDTDSTAEKCSPALLTGTSVPISSLQKRNCGAAALPQSVRSSASSQPTPAVRSRSPSAPVAGTKYNTRSKGNFFRLDGRAGKSEPKTMKATNKYKEGSYEDYNIYRKTYKTYSCKGGFSELADNSYQLYPTVENQSKRLQMSSFADSGLYGHGSSLSPFSVEFGFIVHNQAIKISSHARRELTYDVGIQPVKKRCSAAWDGIREEAGETGAILAESVNKEGGPLDRSSCRFKDHQRGSNLVERYGPNKEGKDVATDEAQKNGRHRMNTRIQPHHTMDAHVPPTAAEKYTRHQAKAELDKNQNKKQHGSSSEGLTGFACSRASRTFFDNGGYGVITQNGSSTDGDSLATSVSSSASESDTFQFFLSNNIGKGAFSCSISSVKNDSQDHLEGDQNAAGHSAAVLNDGSSCLPSSIMGVPTVSTFGLSSLPSSSTASFKVQLVTKTHKRRKKCDAEFFDDSLSTANTKDESCNYYQHATEGFRRRKHRGRKSGSGGSKPPVSPCDDCCKNVLKEVDNSVNLPPARGVWFDSKRNLWRASWRENGSLRTKGFSIGDLGLQEARIQAVAYRIARVPDMEIPADLVGILHAHGETQAPCNDDNLGPSAYWNSKLQEPSSTDKAAGLKQSGVLSLKNEYENNRKFTEEHFTPSFAVCNNAKKQLPNGHMGKKYRKDDTIQQSENLYNDTGETKEKEQRRKSTTTIVEGRDSQPVTPASVTKCFSNDFSEGINTQNAITSMDNGVGGSEKPGALIKREREAEELRRGLNENQKSFVMYSGGGTHGDVKNNSNQKVNQMVCANSQSASLMGLTACSNNSISPEAMQRFTTSGGSAAAVLEVGTEADVSGRSEHMEIKEEKQQEKHRLSVPVLVSLN